MTHNPSSAGPAVSDAAPTPQQVPYAQDGVGAKLVTLRNLRGYRYMEFFLVGSVPVDGQIKGTCYNTTLVNPAPGERDSCPQALVAELRPDELAAKYQVAGVFINPPRHWLLDSIDITFGATRDFGGIQATWCAVLDMPKAAWTPYIPTTIARDSKFIFEKGQEVYLLDDPQGNTWIMKSVTAAKDPANTYDQLSTLASRLELPAGWKFRTRVLEQDLVLIPEGGVARILSDNLTDVYDVTGEGYSNYKP